MYNTVSHQHVWELSTREHLMWTNSTAPFLKLKLCLVDFLFVSGEIYDFCRLIPIHWEGLQKPVHYHSENHFHLESVYCYKLLLAWQHIAQHATRYEYAACCHSNRPHSVVVCDLHIFPLFPVESPSNVAETDGSREGDLLSQTVNGECG